jgi:hypothetical protein
MPWNLYIIGDVCCYLPTSLASRYQNTWRESDFKSAYRRLNVHGDMAAKCSIMYKDFGQPSLRLTFRCLPVQMSFALFQNTAGI